MSSIQTVFLGLFGGIFLLVGLFVLVSGLNGDQSVNDGGPIVSLIMGALFASVGAGVMWLGARHRASSRQLDEAKRRHPSEPWMWNAEWQLRRIEHHAGWSSLGLWGFALFWNAIVILGAAAAGNDIAEQASEEPAILLVLLFPIVGIGLLIAAVRSTLQWRRFGTSALVLRQIPVRAGGELEGTLELPQDVREAEEVVVSLNCLRTTRSGKNTSTATVWSSERRHPRASLGVGPSGPTLDIRFQLPSDVPSTTIGSGYPLYRWQVKATASVSGVDFEASYGVPVFEGSGGHPLEFSADLGILPRPAAQRGAVQRTIKRATTADGASVWNFPPLRAPRAAAFLAPFTAVWTGILYALIAAEAPEIFVIIFGVFEVLLIMGIIDVLLGRIVVTIDRQQLSVKTGPVSLSKLRQVPLQEVKEFRIARGMAVGSTVYYSVEARTVRGSRIIVGKYLSAMAEAEEIAEEMKKEVGMGEKKEIGEGR